MRRKAFAFSIIGIIILSLIPAILLAKDITREEMINELKAPKNRIQRLQASEMIHGAGYKPVKEEDNAILNRGERKIHRREAALDKLIDELEFFGEIAVEAIFKKNRPKTGKTEKNSKLELSSVEFGMEAEITDRLRTYVKFDYDDDEGVEIDKAIIHYQAEAVCKPNRTCHSLWYASLGKMTIPFGYYESHFISNTLGEELGETKETAILFGMYNQMFNIAGGAFDGDMDEAGKNNHIERYFGTARFTLPENILPYFELMSGISYTSNIADSDDFTKFIQEELETESIQRYIDGISVFLSLLFDDRYFIEAEFVSALDELKEDVRLKPRAWSLEFAFRPVEAFELAVRYGESNRALQFLPESQIGIIGLYEIFENTSFALEYQREILNNDDEVRTITSEFVVDF